MANNEAFTLLDDVSLSGQSAAFRWRGGKGSFYVEGSNVGTILLETQSRAGLWLTINGTELTAPGVATFELGIGLIRARHVSSANASASIVRF